LYDFNGDENSLITSALVLSLDTSILTTSSTNVKPNVITPGTIEQGSNMGVPPFVKAFIVENKINKIMGKPRQKIYIIGSLNISSALRLANTKLSLMILTPFAFGDINKGIL
jgi:hypothetical protein